MKMLKTPISAHMIWLKMTTLLLGNYLSLTISLSAQVGVERDINSRRSLEKFFPKLLYKTGRFMRLINFHRGGSLLMKNKNIIERLQKDIVLGAEGYVFELEKRGYIKAGPYVPEVVLDFPDAVRELSKEFV